MQKKKLTHFILYWIRKCSYVFLRKVIFSRLSERLTSLKRSLLSPKTLSITSMLPLIVLTYVYYPHATPQSHFTQAYLQQKASKLKHFKTYPQNAPTLLLFLDQGTLQALTYEQFSQQSYYPDLLQKAHDKGWLQELPQRVVPAFDNNERTPDQESIQGSGFLVKKQGYRWLVSNQHVLEHISRDIHSRVFFDKRHDIAVTQLDASHTQAGDRPRYLKLSSLSHQEINGRHVTIRTFNNAGFVEIKGRAIYSDIRNNTAVEIPTKSDNRKSFVIKVTSTFSPKHFVKAMKGGSGSPVIDTKTGEVVGILTASGYTSVGGKISNYVLFSGIEQIKASLKKAIQARFKTKIDA